MAAKNTIVRKEVIRPGVYTYLHPRTGLPEKLTVTADTIRHFAEQGKAMLASGLSVPVPVEHQPDARPMTDPERAAHQLRNNAGWVKDYEVDKAGRLIGVLDIQDASIASKLPSTIKFTSPWINSFTDGSGKRWDGVVSHVALTTRPRIVEQQPFAADMAAALSLVQHLTTRPFVPSQLDGVGLSLAGLLMGEGAAVKPAYPVAFSLMTGVALGGDEVEEIVKEKSGDDDAEAESESPLDAVDEASDLPGTDQDVTIHEMIGHLLKALGFAPPDGMDETNFERALYETLMAKVQELGAKAAAPEPVEDEKDDLLDDDDGSVNPIIQETPAMYASLAEVNKIADPEHRKLASALFSLQQENAKHKATAEAASKNILGQAKKDRDQRVLKIAKRLPARQRDALLAMVAAPSAQLSLSSDGGVVDPMAAALDIMDAGTVDLPALLSGNGSRTREQAQPSDGTMTPERQQAVVDEVMRNTGGPRVAATK